MTFVFCLVSVSTGVWLAVLNWRCFYAAFVEKRPSPSWVPVLGGALIFTGLYFWPGAPKPGLAWLAFALDWGSLPGIGHAAYFHSRRVIRAREAAKLAAAEGQPEDTLSAEQEQERK